VGGACAGGTRQRDRSSAQSGAAELTTSDVSISDVSGAIERAARDSYGRLVAYLAARSRDVAAAEDALSEAFRAALETWPVSGVPAKPEAWLLVAARRRLIDGARRSRVHLEAAPSLRVAVDQARELASWEHAFPDERLKLLFVCAHPAIDVTARTPLMLQTVLGLDAAHIASAFLVKPSTMGQRLTRAKAKIRDAGIAFEIPEPAEWPQRLDAVLEAIYATYGLGWGDVSGADARTKNLATEAVALGRLLLQLVPAEPEAKGLLALMLYCEARRDARLDAEGHFVPLTEQDTRRWAWPQLKEAHDLLLDAEHAKVVGHFQLEAAIQSVHTRRGIFGGPTAWEEIALLYEGLVRLAPTTGALVGRSAATAEARGAAAGWEQLKAIPSDSVITYQPYWAQAAHLLRRLGRAEEARAAYDRAIGLCENPAMRDFLTRKAAELDTG
jgi:RNA polymerase sigma-70 factor (ECF subfamily)